MTRERSQEHFREYITQILLNKPDILSEIDITDLVVSLETIVLCDRYNK